MTPVRSMAVLSSLIVLSAGCLPSIASAWNATMFWFEMRWIIRIHVDIVKSSGR